MWNLIWYLGFFGLLFKIVTFIQGKLKPKVSLDQFRYGWAVVTGGSDGIGCGLLEQLALRGFKVLMVSRNAEKMEQVCKKLQAKTNNPRVEWVQADFAKSHRDPKKFYAELTDKLAKYNISVLINNVGVTNPRPFAKHTTDNLEDLIGINIYPQTMLMHHFVPLFEERYSKTKQRSLVINLSSQAGLDPFPPMSVYSATKAYDDFLSLAVGSSVSESITMVSVTPLGVDTLMAKQTGQSGNPGLTSSESYAKAVLENLHHEQTRAHWWHEIQALPLQLIPERWHGRIFRQIGKSLGFK